MARPPDGDELSGCHMNYLLWQTRHMTWSVWAVDALEDKLHQFIAVFNFLLRRRHWTIQNQLLTLSSNEMNQLHTSTAFLS
jgi:hypothetical protein